MVIRAPNLQSLTIFRALNAGMRHGIPPLPPTLCLTEIDVMEPEIETFLEYNPRLKFYSSGGQEEPSTRPGVEG